jgi:hypothetical protein
MLTSHASFSQLLTSLEVCWLGNENENLRFALLTDFADSENEPSPESNMLLRQAIADTQALNRRYPPAARVFICYTASLNGIPQKERGWAMNASGENWRY